MEKVNRLQYSPPIIRRVQTHITIPSELSDFGYILTFYPELLVIRMPCYIYKLSVCNDHYVFQQ
jgi:hypothetical protein